MNRTGVILGYQNSAGGLDVFVKSWDDASPYTDRGTDTIYFETLGMTTGDEINAAAIAAIEAFATANSFAFTAILWAFDTPQEVDAKIAAAVPAGLENAPGAAVSDAPADATTNYNVVTTLLGTLVGAVNTANDKQNQIATQLNALLAELRALGLIAS